MEKEQALYHRDEFRTARANASKDAEAYDEVIHAFERLGSVLIHKIGDLGKYEKDVIRLAEYSPLAAEIPRQHVEWHTPTDRLYRIIQGARNDAFHQGAYARHLTTHAIELAIILEDALTTKAMATLVGDFMTRGPVCASLWQPLSFVRQQMLVGSFSYLPLQKDDNWWLISDSALAHYLLSVPDPKPGEQDERKLRLAQTVEDAIKGGLATPPADILRADDPAEKFFQLSGDFPALVCRKDKEPSEEDLIGIITAYDLL